MAHTLPELEPCAVYGASGAMTTEADSCVAGGMYSLVDAFTFRGLLYHPPSFAYVCMAVSPHAIYLPLGTIVLPVLVNKLMPCAWVSSSALEVLRLLLRL